MNRCKESVFLFIAGMLALLSSCNGQGFSYSTKTSAGVGDTVSALSKSLIVIFQDSKGKYWFGSDKDGLYHVDGKTVVHFTTKHGLADQRIRSIQEDKQGNIFISTLGGINKFDGQKFTTLKAVESKDSGAGWKLQPDDLWFCMAGKDGEKGPYRYDGSTLYKLVFPKHYMADEYFKRFPDKAWSPYEVYYSYKDHRGAMWFGTASFGLCRYDGNSLSWMYEDHLTLVSGGGSFGIRSVMEDRNGKFWICNTRNRFSFASDSIKENGKTLLRYTTEQGITSDQFTEASPLYFMSIVEDKNGVLWMATYNRGVWRYDGKEMKQYLVKDGEKVVTLFSVYQDRNHVLWLGTHECGVYRFNGKVFEKFIPGS